MPNTKFPSGKTKLIIDPHNVNLAICALNVLIGIISCLCCDESMPLKRLLFLASVVSASLSIEADENVDASTWIHQLDQAFVQVAEKVSPSVVVIEVAHRRGEISSRRSPDWFERLPDDLKKQFEEYLEKQRERPQPNAEDIFDGKASGVVISKEGFILTNYHVIQGASRLRVRLRNGHSFSASIQGQDPQSDIAVIKIESDKQAEAIAFSPAKFGDSDAVKVGQWAIAIGAPFELDYSVTFGHVSAKGRSGVFRDRESDQDFIQTDADINPGNSGGPLLNIHGEVIGINTLIRGMNTGIGFAIPINMAREIAGQIIDGGKFTRARLGIGIETLFENDDFNRFFPDLNQGVILASIDPVGPAANSGLRPADVIVAVDGVPVATTQQLKNQVRSKSIGKALSLSVFRFGERLEISILPEEWTAPALPEPLPPKRAEQPKFSGLRLRSIDAETAALFGLEESEGIVIHEIEHGSLASRSAWLKPGIRITAINATLVKTLSEVADVWRNVDLKKGVVINFIDASGTPRFEFLKDRNE